MRPRTKSNVPLEVEQVATIELPFKRAQIVLAMVVIGLVVSIFVLSPPTTEPEVERSQRSAIEAGLPLQAEPPTTTAAQANKALIQRAYDDVLNNPNLVVADVCPIPIIYGRCAILKEADLAVVDELFAPNFQHYQPSLPVFISGSRDVRLRLSVYHLAFPDLHYTVEALVAEGDQVVTRWQASGTHSGKFGLHNPTGEQMAWAGMTIWRIADGQIVEAWTIQQGPTFF